MHSGRRLVSLNFSRAFGANAAPRSPAASRFSPQYELGAAEPAVSRLPAPLANLIQGLFKGYPRRDLRPAIQHLLALYQEACQVKAEYILPQMRSSDQTAPSITPEEIPRTIPEYNDEQCMAYVAWQLPLTFGCIERILIDLQKRIPSFHPQSIFDFGTGPGTAIIAALLQWRSSIRSIDAVDISEPMLEMARRLLAHLLVAGTHDEGLPNDAVNFRRFMSLTPRAPFYDLTMAAFSLGDLPDDSLRRSTVNALWGQTRDMLVLVERGTPEGSRIISNARTQLLSSAGHLDGQGETVQQPSPDSTYNSLHIVAPCPHDRKCPMLGSWCHFAHRVELNALQQELNPLGRGFVDQKFSYLVVRRGSRPLGIPSTDDKPSVPSEASFHWPRLIRRPLKRPGHIINDVCSSQGSFERIIVPKSQGKQVYYDARKCKWGDLWPHPPKNDPIPLVDMKITKYRGNRGGK